MNCFEWPIDPHLLFDASRDVVSWCVQKAGETHYFLVFSRRSVVVDEDLCSIKGVMLAIFECDKDGEVTNWNARYEAEGRSLNSAIGKFAFRFANDLISPIDPRANLVGEDERDRLDALLGANDTDFHLDFYRDDDSPS